MSIMLHSNHLMFTMNDPVA